LNSSKELKVNMEKLLESKDAQYRMAIQELELAKQQSLEDSKRAAEELEELERTIKVREDEAAEALRRYEKEREEMSLRFAKQNQESQAALQMHIAEKQKAKLETMRLERLREEIVERQKFSDSIR
jgi:hypothetical protein